MHKMDNSIISKHPAHYSNSDFDFPIWGLLPKKETSVTTFHSKYPEYDGIGTTIAIFDSGVDPGVSGLDMTPDGKVKVIERFDCSGCGDVTMTTIVEPVDGFITGLSGKQLKIPTSWNNPTNNYRIGIKNAFDLYPERLIDRMQQEYKEKEWMPGQSRKIAEVVRKISAFENKFTPPHVLNDEERLAKEDLEALADHLHQTDKKYVWSGKFYDCILYHDGKMWMACIDTTLDGDLENAILLGEYSLTHKYAPLTYWDQLHFSINVHDNGDVLELVGLCSSHGTHVACIAAGYFPNAPEMNGVAPGAQIVSLTIGDGRLGSMETGTAVVRALIKVMELHKSKNIDVINMSYGEHAHWSNGGRIGDLMNEIVNKYGIVFVASAGNHGPALSTIGSPPDISQDNLIGVGAYVSPEMMIAEYAMTKKLSGMPFTWSSRGPTSDGGLGVTVCAPGGAITSVPHFTLRNSQLMNGTSMAAPHVAGAVALLISGLKQKDITFSPYLIKRALENGAAHLSNAESYAQGRGVMNIMKSFDLLTTHEPLLERDVRFEIKCGPSNGKGIYIRNKTYSTKRDFAISVEPKFLDNDRVTPKMKIDFNLRLALVCESTYVRIPPYLDLSNMSRAFAIRIDTSGLYNLNYTYIEAFDVKNIDKGAVFRIPITIVNPIEIEAPLYSLTYSHAFHPNTIKRSFVTVPEQATWFVLRMRPLNTSKNGKFFVHLLQMLPNQSCKNAELHRNVTTVQTSESVVAMQVRGGITLEICLAKYWANIGQLQLNYSIHFYGVKPRNPNIIMHASEGIFSTEVSTLQGEEIHPVITLKTAVQVLKPTESKIIALTERDVIPPGRYIYELNLTYAFHLNKGCDVSPNCPMLSDVLYESEYESQLWMLYDANKQYLGCGDAYPLKYTVKLEKGDYVIKMHVRHDKKEYLDKLTDICLLLNQKLSTPINLEVYTSYQQAITNAKRVSFPQTIGEVSVPLYIAPLPADKYVTKTSNAAQYLVGTISYAKDELAKKVDTYHFKYVLSEGNGKKLVKDKEPTKGKEMEECLDANRDLKVSWLTKADYPPLVEILYKELKEEFPEYLPVHTAYLHAFDPMVAKTQLPVLGFPAETAESKENVQRLIDICDKVINMVDQTALLSYMAIKNDQRSDAAQIKTTMERRKNVLIECLSRKGIYMSRLTGHTDNVDEIVNIWKHLLLFVDPNDSKLFGPVCFAAWHAAVLSQYGRLLKYLTKLGEEKSCKEIDEKIIEVYGILKWEHMRKHSSMQLLSRFPQSYRPF